ncbi:MAG: helix-turn-helix transcriptional regulator [Oscillospiraceae bacterium]|nr:helix-turn-helix transcriptional regulator [Oscillospiraceae bacterium]
MDWSNHNVDWVYCKRTLQRQRKRELKCKNGVGAYGGVSYKRLWELLIDRDMKKRELKEKAGLVSSIITKLNSNQSVTTNFDYNYSSHTVCAELLLSTN